MSARRADRRARRVLSMSAIAGALAALIVVLLAAPAWAHATLDSSSPSDGAQLVLAPKKIELMFSENVEISFGSIALYDQKGDRVDIGAPHHAAGNDRSVETTTPKLSDGAYVVSWRVISADSHPVHGAFTFTIGTSSVNAQGLAARIEAGSGGSRTVGVLFGIARAAEFAGLALLIGAAAFAAAVRPHGRRRSRADALVPIGWVIAFVATAAALLLQGPYAGALPLSEVFHTAVVRAVLHTRYGHFALARLVLLLLALPLLLHVRRSWRPRAWWWVLAAPIGFAIAATPGLAGHAATGTFTQLAVPADTLHVVAMSIWLGGLAALALTVLDRDPDAGRAATNFSPVALTSVLVIVATGVFASWRQVGWQVDAFTGTTYGRLLLVKLGTFVVLLGLAVLSRLAVHARRPPAYAPTALSAAVATDTPSTAAPPRTAPRDPDVRRLRWSVGAEVVFGIAILTITSLLVNAQPARSALALPFSKEIRTPTMLVDIIMDPAKAGPTVIHIYALSPAGTGIYTPGITAQMSLPSKGIEPLDIPLTRAGVNHFKAESFVVPFPGKWVLVVRALRTQIDEVAVQTTVDIR